MGTMVTRKHRELSDDEIELIFNTYHSWKSQGNVYENINGLCKSVTIDVVRSHEYILTPGRYVELVGAVEDNESFDNKMTKHTAELAELFIKSHELDDRIRKQLGSVGYEF